MDRIVWPSSASAVQTISSALVHAGDGSMTPEHRHVSGELGTILLLEMVCLFLYRQST